MIVLTECLFGEVFHTTLLRVPSESQTAHVMWIVPNSVKDYTLKEKTYTWKE